jgi:Raf kinase inhibitor-like YbhB/YbcL family protein
MNLKQMIKLSAGFSVTLLCLQMLSRPAEAKELHGGAMQLTLTSTAFGHMEPIPAKYTCEGENISPPLSWAHLPAGTKSLVLIVDDPDAPDPAAPKMTWIHWVLYNIAPSITGLKEGDGNRPAGNNIMEGQSSWNKGGYGGPCPPIGTHRYFHKLYALNTVLPDMQIPTKAALETAMKGNILAEAVLVGTYRKAKH